MKIRIPFSEFVLSVQIDKIYKTEPRHIKKERVYEQTIDGVFYSTENMLKVCDLNGTEYMFHSSRLNSYHHGRDIAIYSNGTDYLFVRSIKTHAAGYEINILSESLARKVIERYHGSAAPLIEALKMFRT